MADHAARGVRTVLLSRLIAAESFAGQDVLIHDPAEFEHRLAQRQQVTVHLPFAL